MVPVTIRYHQCEADPRLEEIVLEKAQELERFYARIVNCEVTIERPGHHHRKGSGAHYRVRIEVSVPGQHLVVGRDPDETYRHEDPFEAVNDQFRAMRRMLVERHKEKWSPRPKHRIHPPHGRVLRIFRDEGYGFLQDEEGREVYFKASAVLDGAFARLEVGMEVRFEVEQGEKGPQASTVQLLGHEGEHLFPEHTPSP